MAIKELFLRYRRFLQELEAGSFYSLAVIIVQPLLFVALIALLTIFLIEKMGM